MNTKTPKLSRRFIIKLLNSRIIGDITNESFIKTINDEIELQHEVQVAKLKSAINRLQFKLKEKDNELPTL